MHGVSDVTQTEMHTAEPQGPEPNDFEVEMAIEKLKRHKSPGTDQIPAEMIKAGGRRICSEILYEIRRNCLRNGRSRSLYLFIKRAIKQTVVITEAYHVCQLNKIQS